MQDKLKQSKIKICFVSPKAYPLFNQDVKAVFGGAEVDLYYLGTELAKDKGFDVSFVTADYGQAPIERHENTTVIKSVDFEKSPIIGAFRVWKALKKADADIYMIKSISAGLFLVWLFCWMHHRRFVYRTAHSTHCDGTYLKKHLFMGRMFVRSVRQADKVFVQNEIDGENLKKTTGVSSIVMPNGHRLKPVLQNEKDIILWVGRSAAFKHPERFINLAKSFSNEQFVMICQRATGDSSYDALRRKAAEVNNLTFVEHVNFGEIDCWFERAKVFVNTSDSEGFPNTFIQACKAQTAILSFAVNPDGFLDRFRCGIDCKGDKRKLAEELKNMLGERRYVEFGNNGRAYVEQKHDVTQIAEAYKKYFRELV